MIRSLSTVAPVLAACVLAALAAPALLPPHLRHKRVYSTNMLPAFKRDTPQLFPPGLRAPHAARMALLDIGANNGDSYTLSAAQHGHPVIAFEPSPMLAPLFKAVMSTHNINLRVYNFTADLRAPQTTTSGANNKSSKLSPNTVHLIPVALSNTTTVLDFHQSPCPDVRKCGKINHLDPHSKSKSAVKVPVYRLDDVPLPLDAHHIWFMKIDVEGFELQVLRGARKLIKRAAIPYIGVEFGAHGRSGTQWGVDLLDELYLQGYSCHHLRGFGKCHDREFRSPSLKCNYPFSLDDWKTAPTFEEYTQTFEHRARGGNKRTSLADLMCVRRASE